MRQPPIDLYQILGFNHMADVLAHPSRFRPIQTAPCGRP